MQLHAAAARGDIDGMGSALEAGADINACNALKETALVFALRQAKTFSGRRGPLVTPEAVRYLIDKGANPELPDHLGAPAIHHAVAISNQQFLEELLESGADPRHITKSGYSVTTHACYQPSSDKQRAIIKRLFEAGSSLDQASQFGEFPLGVCQYFGDFETLRFLLNLGADPTPLHWTQLHRLVALADTGVIKELAPTAAVINTVNPRFGLSPWLLSFMRGETQMIRVLAELGGDLTQAGRCGESLLHLAARFGHRGTVHWLLDLGADPNALNDFATTPLHEAVRGDQIECVHLLLEHGAHADLDDHVQSQPIHAARSLGMLRTLVNRGGADPNAVDGCGEWPLKDAAGCNDLERIKWLLDHGAEVDLTSTGETALHTAVGCDSRETVDLLLSSGANPNQQDVDGWTPLFSAQSREAILILRRAGADPRITDETGSGPESRISDPILLKALTEPL